MNIKNNKRMIIEKEKNPNLLDIENNKYYLEEYFPYRKDSCIIDFLHNLLKQLQIFVKKDTNIKL